MRFERMNYEHLLGAEGFSDQMLKNHFTLYGGYVDNANALADHLATLAKSGKTGDPEFAELTRRFGWEFNGMRLHEYYFGNMTKSGGAPESRSRLYETIVRDFKGFPEWESQFRAVGASRGIGWSALYFDHARGGRLINTWIDEHNTGHLSGAAPILVMDVFEHAYMMDYGLKRADYIEAFFRAIDWRVAGERFDRAALAG